MADNNHLFSVPRYNGTMLNNEYCNDFFDFGQQKTIKNTSFISMALYTLRILFYLYCTVLQSLLQQNLCEYFMPTAFLEFFVLHHSIIT